jgi:hypothetical protein
MPINSFPFDMVVNADITINGLPLKEGMQVGAFVGNEIRGLGVQRQFFGITYTELRVYSPLNPITPYTELNKQDPLYPYDEELEPEKVVIRVYDCNMHIMYESPDTITFDGMTHGYPSSLYPVELK